jgi:ElaB/YqjD/DUF883 family membrane-anchored ribosome-binding protein
MVAPTDTKDTKADTSQLAADIEQLKEDLKKLSGTIVGLGRDGLEAAQSGGAEQLRAWRDDVDDMASSLKKKGQHQVDLVEGQIRDKPLLTLLVAFGVGMLVSRFVGHR